MNGYLHFTTCFIPVVSVYLPPTKYGPDAIHQDDYGQLWNQRGQCVFPSKGKSPLRAARAEVRLQRQMEKSESAIFA